MARRTLTALMVLVVVSSVLLPLGGVSGHAAAAEGGISAEYRVTVVNPPEPSISVEARFTGIQGPLLLAVGFFHYAWDSLDSLDLFKNLQLTSGDGNVLSPVQVDRRTIQVTSGTGVVVASYSLDLSKTSTRACKVDWIGGVFSGLDGFLVPTNQTLSRATVSFVLPPAWQVVSVHPQSAGVFTIEPITYQDLAREVQASGWFFGIVDIDQTVVCEDGFAIRVVGFKNFAYEHWNTYLGTSPTEEALKTADFFKEAYSKLKGLYGEFPVDRMLVVGPGFWQAGMTWANQQLPGEFRYEWICHHLTHAYFSDRVLFKNRFYSYLQEGYATYWEGIATAEIAKDPIWRGMLYERKFHYIRGLHFGNMEQNSRQYVLGFITTFLMDKQIREHTGGSKGIDDLMVAIWHRYKGPNEVWVTDEEVLTVLKELTGTDWQGFYRQNIEDTSHLDVAALDTLKPDFALFLRAIADYWYGGHPSAYFVNQELISAVGDFDAGVRFQQPFGVPPLLPVFILQVREQKDVSREQLTEADVERAMGLVTGKDHSDFFEFYRDQGFVIDPADITEYVRTFHWPGGGMSDQAVRMTPQAISLGQATPVLLELVDPAFAGANELFLSVAVFDVPEGLASLDHLVTGEGVRCWGEGELTEFDIGEGLHVFFDVPKIARAGKTYTKFTLNLPQDAGVMRFTLNARAAESQGGSCYGGFIGTKKVFFQDLFTVPIGSRLGVFVNRPTPEPPVDTTSQTAGTWSVGQVAVILMWLVTVFGVWRGWFSHSQ